MPTSELPLGRVTSCDECRGSPAATRACHTGCWEQFWHKWTQQLGRPWTESTDGRSTRNGPTAGGAGCTRTSQGAVQHHQPRDLLYFYTWKTQAAFARHKLDLGHFTRIKHQINTSFAAPVKERVWPTPRGFEAEEKECLEEQLAAGVIRPSTSPWAAATVLVRKTDNSVRYCCDFRKLNDRTVKDAYPLPRIDMCLSSLGGVRWFSTLDLQAGYWQIGVEESDIPKTAFITKYGLFEYTKLPFGLCNGPSTFQRCMELVFRGLQWHTLLIYLDDIIVTGRSMEENLDRLAEVLQRLEEADLKLKPSKCSLLQEQVLFLGHLVSAKGVQPNPRLVEAVLNWEVPENRTEVQQYLGLCNYYRRFIPAFSGLAAPLTELTSKKVQFHWSQEAQTSFEALKRALCSAPTLSFPLPTGDFILDTDASNVCVGGVLQQVQDNEERVIAYSSKKLNKQQRRYCVTRRELLAIVVFLREFRHYLLGVHFTIHTDHGSLTWLLGFKEPQGQLDRWLEYILQFKFSIMHQPGTAHGNADALSRRPEAENECNSYQPRVLPQDLPCGGCTYCHRHHEEWSDFHENVDVVPLSGVCRRVQTRNQTKIKKPEPSGVEAEDSSWAITYSPNQLQDAQLQDSNLQVLHQRLDAEQKPPRDEAAALGPELRSYWLNFEVIRRIDGVAYLMWIDEKGIQPTNRKLLVPKEMRVEVLQLCHDALFAGHMGVQKTVSRIKQRFHWYRLRDDVKVHIRSCPTCSATKMPYRKFRAALGNFRVGAPLDRVAIDIMGPLPLSSKGNRYILVIVDYFTRWVEAFALPDQKAETVAHPLVHDFVCRFGTPLELHSDQGRNFESHLFQEVCRLFQIAKTRTTPYHPSSNGLVERFNRTLAFLIRSYLEEHTTDWDLHIPVLTAAYRATVHPSTGFTPNFMMFGRETTMPVHLPLSPRARGANFRN